MTTPKPFLTLDERLEYLSRKNYLFDSETTDDDRSRLATLNFHYFLGYARNYRHLASIAQVPTDDVLARVLRLVELDRALSVVLFDGLRRLEWKLRACLVDQHCGLFPTTTCYLDVAHYRVFNPRLPELHTSLRKHIERSREPFVAAHLAQGLPTADLPIWAVVDTWTFSDLSRVVSETAPVVDQSTGEERRLSKGIAGALGVSASTIISNLEAISVLRNLVAHHSRLWMRPATIKPQIPKVYPAHVRRGVDPESLYGVFLALAELLGHRLDGQEFLRKVDAIVDSNPAYKLGITRPVSKSPLGPTA